ncbi:hypothetical protein SDC9_125654 [bioreactor metagenome]|uniref:Uncharacterized protein n=1 Tax=bioreactor metagenome TaxID=1076179 RepID=A0A645CNY0_9ZZZZ
MDVVLRHHRHAEVSMQRVHDPVIVLSVDWFVQMHIAAELGQRFFRRAFAKSDARRIAGQNSHQAKNYDGYAE